MKTADKKRIRESRKARWFYSVWVAVAMLISLGGIFLAKTGHGGAQLFPDSFGSLSLLSIVGWAVGAGGAIAAVVISRMSKGIFVLTREKVAFEGMTEKENWEVPRSLIRDCGLVNSWFDGMTGASRILLTIEDPGGNGDSIEIGPFPEKTAALWMKDLQRIIEGETEKRTKEKGQEPDDSRLLEPLSMAISHGI
ncbi:MAG: hypothetical protein WC405_06080 [Syntrophales bacterium]